MVVMRNRVHLSPTRLLIVLLSVAMPLSALALKPEPHFTQQTVKVLQKVRQIHYRHINLRDTSQQEAFLTDYLDSLDPSHSLFTRHDVLQLRNIRTKMMQEILNEGNLKSVFHIYNRYLARATERLNYQIRQLERGTPKALDKGYTILIDRSEEPYARDIDELRLLWDKLLANAFILVQLQQRAEVASKTPRKPADKILIKRLKLQRNRLKQIKPVDAYTVFMNSLLRLYDPHTQYKSPYMREDFEIAMAAQLEGIGALLTTKDEYVQVHSLTPGGPAARDGRLKSGDLIIGVAQGRSGEMVDVVGLRLDDIVRQIRGAKNSIVRLSVLSEDSSTSEIDIVRDKVSLEEQAASAHVIKLRHKGHDWNIAVARLPVFYEGTPSAQSDAASASRDLRNALDELMESNDIDAIVLDLRNNGGGSLTEANKVSGLFLGEIPVVQIEDSLGNQQILADSNTKYPYRHPMAVLVNPLTASASEIVAAAIQDYGRGLIIGSRTHGKGTVQNIFPVGEGQVNVTIAKFFRVSGGSTQNRGILPDLKLPTLLDTSKIGERNLKTALPWTSIKRLYYRPISPVAIHKLKSLQQGRADTPPLVFLEQQQQLLNEYRNRKSLPLNLAARKNIDHNNRIRTLSMTNIYRRKLQQKVFTSYQEMEEWRQQQQKLPRSEQLDMQLDEAVQVLLDYVSLNSRITRSISNSATSLAR